MTTTTATTTVAIFITPLRPFAGVDAISGVSSSGSGASSSIDTTFGFVREYMGDCSRAQRAARARCNSTHGLDLGPRGERYCNEGFSPVIRESSRPKRRVDGRVPHRRRGPRAVQPRYGQSTGYLPGPLESGPPVFVGPKTLHVFAVPFHSAIPPSDPGNVKLYFRGANTRAKSPCGFEGMGDVLGL